MSWNSYINGFNNYLLLEKGLSDHSIEAYLSDVQKLADWAASFTPPVIPTKIHYGDLQLFIAYINELGLSVKSQARIISGIKSFYRYLIIEGLLTDNPSELLEGPKLSRKIPDILSIEEMEAILNDVDLSHPQGHRNKAILEVLYASGLRVSELTGLKLSNYFNDLGLVRVVGKNNKERIVPIGNSAIKSLDLYIHHVRNLQKTIQSDAEDLVFLNRRGARLSRIMVYNIVKDACKKAGISKKVSPHTFRHSFATHLVEGGANLKAVQDMLGHESITTTEIYTHMDTRFLRETILTCHPRNR